MFAGIVEELQLLDEHGLATRLQELDRQRRALDAELAAVVNLAERRSVHRADGHVSVCGWVKALTNCSDAEAARVRNLGRLVHDLPVVGDALHDGEIGHDQAGVLARVRRNPRCGDRLADVISLLIGQAAGLPFRDFRLCARRWELLADTDGAHKHRELNHEVRNASAHVDDNGLELRASGGNPLDAAELVEIFDKFREAEFLNDWDAAVAVHGAGTNGTHLGRSDPQRRFDALLAIFRAAAGAPLDHRNGEPTVNIVVDQRTFTNHLAQLLGETDVVMTPDPGTARCETSHGAVLHPDDVIRAALIGRVRRVVLDQAGTVIDLGRRQRLFTGRARDAVLLHATRCLWPGCSIPSRSCQADHLHPWINGGATTSSNGGPVCQHHNRWKARGYTTRRDSTGIWHTLRPDGTPLTQPPLAA